MTEALKASIDELVENFELLGDWESRFEYLIDLGKELPSMQKSDQSEENKVHGCQAQVWMKLQLETDGKLTISADSDAFIVRGLIAVLLMIYGGRTAEEIINIDGHAELQRLKLADHLSPTRKNGLFSMLQRIRDLATAHIADSAK